MNTNPSYVLICGSFSYHVQFDVVEINVGGAWRTSTNQIIAPYSGKYYIILDVSSGNYLSIQFELIVNNARSMIARYLPENANTSFAASTPRGQSGIMQLNVGDILYVAIPKLNMCCYALFTTFSGIYLGP